MVTSHNKNDKLEKSLGGKNMAGIKPITKKVSEIEGVFVVPSYQRGYRWGTDEVVRLLVDIYNLHGN